MVLTEAQKGPAEQLLDLTLDASAHLWHKRPGLDVGGTWHARRGAKKEITTRGTPVKPVSASPPSSASTLGCSTFIA